jgi:hypothetical protein
MNEYRTKIEYKTGWSFENITRRKVEGIDKGQFLTNKSIQNRD